MPGPEGKDLEPDVMEVEPPRPREKRRRYRKLRKRGHEKVQWVEKLAVPPPPSKARQKGTFF